MTGISYQHVAGYAEDTVDLVNQGNLLYITGAIMSAGMILVWAITR
jgi:hypothetical protein